MSVLKSASLGLEPRTDNGYFLPETTLFKTASVGMEQTREIRFGEDIYFASASVGCVFSPVTQARRRRIILV